MEEEIVNKMKRNLSLNSVPIGVIKEFKEYCESNSGGVYSVGLQQLLEQRKLMDNLIPLLSNLYQKVDMLESQINTQQKSRKEVKTFE